MAFRVLFFELIEYNCFGQMYENLITRSSESLHNGGKIRGNVIIIFL